MAAMQKIWLTLEWVRAHIFLWHHVKLWKDKSDVLLRRALQSDIY